MFVYMSAEPLFHLYLDKEQKKALSSVVNDEILTAFCRFFQRRRETAGMSEKEDRHAQRDLELETGGAAKIQPVV